MATVTISLPDPMKDWIEAQAGNGKFSGVSDYIRDLVRQDQSRKDVVILISTDLEGK